MQTLSVSIIGALAVGGALLALPREARAQYYGYYPAPSYGYVPAQPYGYGYVPARPRYRARQYYNQLYGTYWDACGNRLATLGYCQRNPYCCQ